MTRRHTPSGRFIAQTFFRALAVALIALAAVGCAPVVNPVSIVSTIADGVSYVATGKSSTDHVISKVADKDCAMHRGISGEAVCKTNMAAATSAEVAHRIENPIAGPSKASLRSQSTAPALP